MKQIEERDTRLDRELDHFCTEVLATTQQVIQQASATGASASTATPGGRARRDKDKDKKSDAAKSHRSRFRGQSPES